MATDAVNLVWSVAGYELSYDPAKRSAPPIKQSIVSVNGGDLSARILWEGLTVSLATLVFWVAASAHDFNAITLLAISYIIRD